jgi:hypothetical protein
MTSIYREKNKTVVDSFGLNCFRKDQVIFAIEASKICKVNVDKLLVCNNNRHILKNQIAVILIVTNFSNRHLIK